MNSAAALMFFLPGVCTHTDTEGKKRKARVLNILKYKKTQYSMNTLYEAGVTTTCEGKWRGWITVRSVVEILLHLKTIKTIRVKYVNDNYHPNIIYTYSFQLYLEFIALELYCNKGFRASIH